MGRKILEAKAGFVFTNGSDFGRTVYLAKEDDGADWYEAEETILETAEEADYQAALRKFGVQT